MDRRSYLGALGMLSASALAGCSQSGANARNPDRPDFDGFLTDANSYDGVTDGTGESVVTVAVGGKDGMSFVPAAVRIDSGSTVRWEWSGVGGTHNVKAEDGSFESKYGTEAGTTFEQMLDTPGGVKYVCVPHAARGMKGVVVVEQISKIAKFQPRSPGFHARIGNYVVRDNDDRHAESG